MKGIVAALAAIVVSCTAPAASSPPPPTPTAPPTTASPTAPPSPAPTQPSEVRLDVAVAVASDPFPIVPSLVLQRAAVEEEDENLARLGVERYIEALDRYREGGGDPAQLGLTGAFRDAVVAGIAASATPGVQRRFALESLQVERVYRKPWGTRALLEVAVTIVDRAVDGSAPDQREVGLLRMVGDRPHVTDSWDTRTRAGTTGTQ